MCFPYKPIPSLLWALGLLKPKQGKSMLRPSLSSYRHTELYLIFFGFVFSPSPDLLPLPPPPSALVCLELLCIGCFSQHTRSPGNHILRRVSTALCYFSGGHLLSIPITAAYSLSITCLHVQ